MRRICRWMCVVLLAAATGCGGAGATAFSTKTKPLAQRMLQAVEQKDTGQIDKMVDLLESRDDTLTPDEMAVLQTAAKYAKSGSWDSAQSLLESSIAMSE